MVNLLPLIVVLLSVFNCAVESNRNGNRNGNNYGYYGNSNNGYFGYYGNQFSCGGYSYYAVCPDRSRTPGFCIQNTCANFGTGYTCINPGICCPSYPNTVIPTTNSCPTGLFSGECPLGICTGISAGQTCTPVASLFGTARLCCATTTAAINCPLGVGAGTCLPTPTGLTCGTGFVCTALSGQNICCPTTAASNKRSGRDKIICSGLNTGCNEGLTCHDGRRCVNHTAVVNSIRGVSKSVCPNDAIATGLCTYNPAAPSDAPTCPENSFCFKTSNFCCLRHQRPSPEPKSSDSAEVKIQVEQP